MRKVISIFLASSIKELKLERYEILEFIRSISDEFEEKYDVKIQPLVCENFDTDFTLERKQEEYNKKIRQSKLCFFIFFTKAGRYTVEEFHVAQEHFRKNGFPKIYTYFKDIKEGTGEQSLYEFMAELDNVFGHYYSTFEHLDTVKLRILLSLKLTEMDYLEVKVEDGKCVVDGEALLDLSEVSEFANSKNLTRLQAELEKVEEKYFMMKPIYAKGNCDKVFYKEYSTVAAKREQLINEIEENQRLIFNMSLRISKDSVYGDITERQKEAYRLFELGDYEGCMAILDYDEIRGGFLRERERLKAQETALCKRYVREQKTAIDILTAMVGYKERFAEIEKRYEEIVPVILEMGIELLFASDYVAYLFYQKKKEKALETALQLKDNFFWKEKADVTDKAWLINLIGGIYASLNNPIEAEKYYNSALLVRRELAKENPEKYNRDLASSYSTAGGFFERFGQREKAYEYRFNAIALYEELEAKNPGKYKKNLAFNYCKAADYFEATQQLERAEEYHQGAISIFEVLVKDERGKYSYGLSWSYICNAGFYGRRGELLKAEECFLKAISILADLAQDNPERYNGELSLVYFDTGKLYTETDKEKEEQYFKKALEIALKTPNDDACSFVIEKLT